MIPADGTDLAGVVEQLPSALVSDQLDGGHRADAPDVAHDGVPLLQGPEPVEDDPADRIGAREENTAVAGAITGESDDKELKSLLSE